MNTSADCTPEYARFFQFSPDLCCIIERDGTFHNLNPAWQRVLGFSLTELQAKPYLDWVHPDDQSLTLTQLQPEKIVGDLLTWENRYQCHNGDYKWFSWLGTYCLETERIYACGRDITQQKIAEITYQKIYENAVEGVYQLAPTGRYLRVNQTLANLYGDPSPEALLERLQNVEHQLYVDPHRWSEFSRLMVEYGRVINFESAIYQRNRNIIWVIENARAVRDSQGNLLYYEGFVQDITHRKQVESNRVSSEILWRKQQNAWMSLAGCPGIYTGNLTDAWNEMTRIAALTLGIDRVSVWFFQTDYSQLICARLYELQSDQYSQGVTLNLQDYPCYFQALTQERMIVADNAQTDLRTLELTTLYLTPRQIVAKLDITIRVQGRMVGVLSLESRGKHRHWTVEEKNFASYLSYMATLALESYERILTEAELEHSLSLLQATFESTADGILVITNEGKIVSFNQKFSEMWQLPPAVVKQTDQILSFLREQLKNDQVLLSCNLGEHLIQVHEVGYDILQLKDGRVFERYAQLQVINRESDKPMPETSDWEKGVPAILKAQLSKFASLSGTAHLWVWSFRDITERQKIERLKNEFVSMVSHELRTPLTSIRGSLSLMMGGIGGEIPPQAKSLVEIALKNSERLVVLINDILDIEKIESGKMDFSLQPINLVTFVQEAIEFNRGYGEQLGVNFVLDTNLSNVRVNVDRDRLMQVITNLLSNAAKFSPPQGTVVVSITRPPTGTVTSSSPQICVSVQDHGPGIPENFRHQIFQKFAQADSSDARQKGGSGLGLSISKVIIEKLGGTIWFDTELNVGTTFHFDLPEFLPTPPPLSIPAQMPASDNQRILICEDDPDIATLLSLILKSGNFQADIAYNATEAKQLLATHFYVAMTLDISLPGQDGLSLIQELREQPATQHLPIIVVSATALQGKAELQGAGFAVLDWLEKPIDQNRLMAAVQHASLGYLHQPKILHLEDDPDVQQVVSMILRDLAIVHPASSLEAAREKLKAEKFDLVLLDFGLPDGSGLELIAELNQSAADPTPVVVFSAREMSQEVINQVAASLVKSRTSNQQLLTTIRSLIKSSP